MKNFSYKQFNNLNKLIKIKKEKGLTIGIGLPVLNEEDTIADTIKVVNECGDLIDKVVVIDSGSTDSSINICKKLGIKVIPDTEAAKTLKRKLFKGKGFNLWSSTYLLKTDIVIWIDTDIRNISKKFILGIVGPMIVDTNISFVKGYYKRSKKDGRVTEIMARPLINLIWPELNQFIQPLSGEYGGRSDFLKKISFFSGYSVEIAIDIQSFIFLKQDQIAQSFLGTRFHGLQSVASLGKMSSSILRTVFELSKRYGRLKFHFNNGSEYLKKFSYGSNNNLLEESIYIKDEELKPIK